MWPLLRGTGEGGKDLSCPNYQSQSTFDFQPRRPMDVDTISHGQKSIVTTLRWANNDPIRISWWRHQMETFSALLALSAGSSSVSGEFPSQRPVTQSFDVFFHLCLNKRLSKQSWGWWFETPSRSIWLHGNTTTKADGCRYHQFMATNPSSPPCDEPTTIQSVYVEMIYILRLHTKSIPKCSSRVTIHKMNRCLWFMQETLQWRHNGRDSVSNRQPHDCLLNRLFRRRSKKTSKLRVTGFCAGNSPVPGEFPAQMASYAENVSIWWRHHENYEPCCDSQVE